MNVVAVDRDGGVHELIVSSGDVLMEVLRDNGLGIEAVCGGCRACATCHVLLDQPSLVAGRGEDEEALLSVSEHFDSSRSRLSCQIELAAEHAGMRVVVAPED